MATRSKSVVLKQNIDFDGLIMNALSSNPNFSVSINGNTAKCEEISAPTVGMGFNTWKRGRAYTTITYDERQKVIEVETSINGLTGAIWNGKYASEICDSIVSKLQNQIKRIGQQSKHEKEISIADEIIKLKSLLDSGIITQEEFDKMKKELLG